MGLRAFRTVFMSALAIRRPTPTWDFIIINKGLIEPPHRGEARPPVFQNFSPISVPSQKERQAERKKEQKKERKKESKH